MESAGKRPVKTGRFRTAGLGSNRESRFAANQQVGLAAYLPENWVCRLVRRECALCNRPVACGKRTHLDRAPRDGCLESRLDITYFNPPSIVCSKGVTPAATE